MSQSRLSRKPLQEAGFQVTTISTQCTITFCLVHFVASGLEKGEVVANRLLRRVKPSTIISIVRKLLP